MPAADIEQLQENLILSHAVGVGDEVAAEIVRLMLLLKVNGLAVGRSGVTERVVDYLIRFYNADALPVVYSKGSLGASGDLAPLAHMVLPLLGLGEMDYQGKRLTAAKVLKLLGLKPLKLQSKEGLGLINGTAVHVGLRRPLSLAYPKCREDRRHRRRHDSRGRPRPARRLMTPASTPPGPTRARSMSQKISASCSRGSKILPSHADCAKVQDPYSLRCVPQVHGAVRLAIEHARGVVETEINSATDNPLVFENGEVISGGNFHGEPLAFILDYLAIATAEIASIAERRIYMLLHGDTIGDLKVPRLLMKDTGLNSGFMIPQYTAAALVSENKVFAHPASVDSIPSSLGQEDHVSMGSISATKLLEVVKNTETVLAIEFMCSAQGLEFLRPLKSGPGVEAAFAEVRRYIPFAQADRLFHNDVQTALALVRSEQIAAATQRATGRLL